MGSLLQQKVPIAVLTNGALNTKTVKYISAGADFVIAVDDAGIAYSWGDNTNGDGGQNSATQYFDNPQYVYAADVLSGQKIVMVSSGSSHTLALSDKGRVFAWGGNANGNFLIYFIFFYEN